MRKGLFTLGVLAVAALLVTSSFAGSRGVTFTPVGFIEDPGPYPASSVTNSNPAGTEFMVTPSPYGIYCVSWTMEGGWGYHVGNASGLCHLAADGTIMADGYPAEGPDWPAYWAGTVGVWDPLLPPTEGYEACGSSQMGIFGMGGNGDFATGLTWQIYDQQTSGNRYALLHLDNGDGTATFDWSTTFAESGIGAWFLGVEA